MLLAVESVIAVARKRRQEFPEVFTVLALQHIDGAPVPNAVVICDGKLTTTEAMEAAGWKVELGFEDDESRLLVQMRGEGPSKIDLDALKEISANLAGYIGESAVSDTLRKYGATWEAIKPEDYAKAYEDMRTYLLRS